MAATLVLQTDPNRPIASIRCGVATRARCPIVVACAGICATVWNCNDLSTPLRNIAVGKDEVWGLAIRSSGDVGQDHFLATSDNSHEIKIHCHKDVQENAADSEAEKGASEVPPPLPLPLRITISFVPSFQVPSFPSSSVFLRFY